MKSLKYILSLMLLSSSMIAFSQTSPETTKRIVIDKSYIFVADAALPMASADVNKVLSAMGGGRGGGIIILTGSQYEFSVTKDSVVAYLPYYGRAYSANLGTTDGGIKFTSKDFSYKETKRKKGAYDIEINTNDVALENYRLNLNITENGYATLTVSSINKQQITFNGHLREQKSK